MRIGKQCLTVILGFLLVVPSWGAQAVSPSQIQHDSQAMTILSRALGAAGGARAIAAIQDFSATGTITYYWDPEVSGSATVQGRGSGQLRIDATLQDGLRTVIVNNGTGSITQPDGSVTSIPYESAINLGSMTLPCARLVADVQDTSLKITYVGLVDHGGQQLHDIRVQKIYPMNLDPDGSRRALSERDFFVDPNTFLVASVANIVVQDGEGNGVFREVVFANYQTFGGVVVPLQITEKIHGQPMVSLHLSQLVFNSGLTDADFTK